MEPANFEAHYDLTNFKRSVQSYFVLRRAETVTLFCLFCFTHNPKFFYSLAVRMHFKTSYVLRVVNPSYRTKTYNKESG